MDDPNERPGTGMAWMGCAMIATPLVVALAVLAGGVVGLLSLT